MGQGLLALGAALYLLVGAADPEPIALKEARQFLAAGRNAEACQAYAAALNSGLPDLGRREALLQLGRCQQAEQRWDEAIATYSQFLSQLPAGEGSNSDFVYGQWGIAECLFGKGNYPAALEAMRAMHGHQIQTFCGTCRMLIERRQILREAVLHEYVKDYARAVSGYFTLGTTAEGLRLLALYDAANQLPTLLKLVERESQWFDAVTKPYRRECQNGVACAPKESELYRTVHRMLDLRKLEKERNWPALLAVLEPPSVGGQWERPDHEPREAARLLASHARETLPLLLPNVSKRPYYPYALGLTGRAEAVAALQEEVRKEKNYGQLLPLIDALLAAGPAGAAALEALYPLSHGNENLKLLIERYRNGTLHDDPVEVEASHRVFPFPAPPKRARLPNTCTFQGAPANEWECTVEPRARE